VRLFLASFAEYLAERNVFPTDIADKNETWNFMPNTRVF